MNRNHLAAVLATILIVTGMLALHQNEQDIQKEPQTVPFVNLTRYSGTWWEQSYIPYYWERGCANTHAIYSIKDNGEVKVDNHCDKNGQDAHNVGKAIAEDSTNAKLKI
jgi:apolipoprotein D and lipocalin family protein